MLYSGTDPESYITEYTLVYEDNVPVRGDRSPRASLCMHRAAGAGFVAGTNCRAVTNQRLEPAMKQPTAFQG